jgi:AcrR family transcriptional regulator
LASLLNESCEKYDNEIDIICSFVAGALDEDRAELAAISELAALREDQRNGIVGLYKGLRLVLAEIIYKGIKKGEIRPVNAQVSASILLGMIFWVPVLMRWPAARELTRSEIISTIQQIIRVGIARERGEPKTYEAFDFDPFISISGNAFSTELRAAARRETLLASASWLFNQKGIDATSMDEVAQRVGMSKKVIYHNVGNKENLVAECYKRSFRLFEFIARQVNDAEGSRIDALCTGVASLTLANSRQDIAPIVPITGHESWPDDMRSELLESQVTLMELSAVTYGRGREEKSFRLINDLCVTMVTPGMYEWVGHWLETLPEHEQKDIGNQTANFLRLGLSAV